MVRRGPPGRQGRANRAPRRYYHCGTTGKTSAQRENSGTDAQSQWLMHELLRQPHAAARAASADPPGSARWSLRYCSGPRIDHWQRIGRIHRYGQKDTAQVDRLSISPRGTRVSPLACPTPPLWSRRRRTRGHPRRAPGFVKAAIGCVVTCNVSAM